jgi:glutathione S-transferase
MVKLLDSDIRTREIRDWKGLHLFHFMGSSCSQKTRIFLAEKDAAWESHHVDLAAFENFTEWYLGINPRGLLPTLVHDGEVHIESNDIMRHVDAAFGGPKLFPDDPAEAAYLETSLNAEDDLHLYVRTLTFRFMAPTEKLQKDPKALDVYASAGSGTVGGRTDTRKPIEVAFWRDMAAHGIPDEKVLVAVDEFTPHFVELDTRLQSHDWLLASGFSMLDIAWWITVHRLVSLGYPIGRYDALKGWYGRLAARAHFMREVAPPPERAAAMEGYREQLAAEGRTLADLMAANARQVG